MRGGGWSFPRFCEDDVTQFCIEEALVVRHSLWEQKLSEEADPDANKSPDLIEAERKARHFAQTGERL